MKREQVARRAPELLLLLLVAVAAWPFLARQGLPLETDAELHVFRLAELARLVGGGELYPRWAPNFYFGYGYPIFNYYAPLAYYLGLPLALIPGIGAVVATRFVFIFTFLAGAFGLYGFVKDWWGRRAALVAATAYIYAPYLLYVDPHARGDLAEFLSFGLFPPALWAFSRLLQRGGAGPFAGATVATALVILSHNLMALVFFALLSGWVFWQIALSLWLQKQEKIPADFRGWRRARGQWPVWALVLSVGMTAFFWLPVALEQDAVNLSTLIGDGGHFDFRNHFLYLRDLLGPSVWLDWGATEPGFSLNLGMAQWLLALLGVAGLATGFARHRQQGLFFALVAALLLFLMTPYSTAIWQTVPMMPYLQFPWRLLGPSAALLAVLGGIGVQSVMACLSQLATRSMQQPPAGEKGISNWLGRRQWVAAFALLPLLLQSLPLLMIPPWTSVIQDTSASAVAAVERQGRWLGTTSTADFVPRTVEVLPRPQASMLEQLLAGEAVDRVNRATLPQDAVVESEVVAPLHFRYRTASDSPFLLRLFLFHFPGWRAQVDGADVEITLGRPEGFIVVPAPAGEHTIEVQFMETPARRAAWIVSGAGLLALAFLTMRLRSLAGQYEPVAMPIGAQRDKRSVQPWILPLFLVVLLFIASFALGQWQGLFHYNSQGLNAIPARYDRQDNLGGQIYLIGFDAPQEASPGETIEVVLYWKAQQEMEINYQVFVHLLDTSGVPVQQSDKLNPGEFPTRRWPADKYVRDIHQLALPASLPVGRYHLSVGMWVQDEGWRLPLLDENGVQMGDAITLLEIEVR